MDKKDAIYLVDTGYLLDKEDKDYQTYGIVYDHEYGYYDEEMSYHDDKAEAMRVIDNFVRNHPMSYGIMQIACKRKKDFYDRTGKFSKEIMEESMIEYETFKAEDVIYSAANFGTKTSNKIIKKNLANKPINIKKNIMNK